MGNLLLTEKGKKVFDNQCHPKVNYYVIVLIVNRVHLSLDGEKIDKFL